MASSKQRKGEGREGIEHWLMKIVMLVTSTLITIRQTRKDLDHCRQEIIELSDTN